jgi:hypothetical protein
LNFQRAGLAEALLETGSKARTGIGRPTIDESDQWYSRLLRTSDYRPSRRPRHTCNEIPPAHRKSPRLADEAYRG